VPLEAQFDGGAPTSGKSAVASARNNSAHDIAADLWEHGAESVTHDPALESSVVCTSDALMEPRLGQALLAGGRSRRASPPRSPT